MRIDLHCHTEASFDCVTPISRVLARCREKEIVVQAITDHNLIWAAERLKELSLSEADGDIPNPTIIVGEEVSTNEGEIIGLYLRDRVPAGLSPEESIARIKDQGGLVLLPHGFDPLKRKRLRPTALARVADAIDIVETFNTRVSRPRWNQTANDWAVAHEALKAAGSDAHTLADIGSAWVETPLRPIEGPEDLLAALRVGTVVGEWTHPLFAFAYKMWDFGYQLAKRPFRGESERHLPR